MERTTVILCGASVRAAAYSALRAGFSPWCVDLFRDADLVAVCPEAMRIEDYPQSLPTLLVQRAPTGPCVFTGALENHPAILAEIGKQRPVWGMTSEVLQEVRQPERLQMALGMGGFPTLETRRTTPTPDSAALHPGLYSADSSPGLPLGHRVKPRMQRSGIRGMKWLRKSLASAGGQSISFWDESHLDANISSCYWQEYRPGESYSAVYLGDGASSFVIGLCEQLIGQPWLHAAPFAYCGNIGPLLMTHREQTFLQSLGTCLAQRFCLRGLFGLDLIRSGESFLVTEVNPRYTASVELYELAYHVPLLAWHGDVYQPSGVVRRHLTGGSPPCLGKAIIYAPKEITIPPDFLAAYPRRHHLWQLPAYADIPPPGTVIQAGQPVLTFFSSGNDAAACRVALEKESYSLDRLFHCL